MARPRVGDKHKEIRKATIDEVVDNGFAAVSVNKIAKRAGLAVGTIYRYFDDKEDLFRAIYLEIKSDLHAHVMAAAAGRETSKDRIKAAWFALLEYACHNPNDFLFTESMGAQNILNVNEQKAVEQMASDLQSLLETAIEDGTMSPAPLAAVMMVLTAPAIQLARQSALNNTSLDDDLADEIFAMCWKAVAVH